MHVHSSQARLNPVNPYSAAAEWAITMQQSANGAKTQGNGANSIEGIPGPGEASLLADWMDALHSEALNGHTLSIHSLPSQEYHSPAAGQESSFV
jgi:hypothetical protein